MAANGDDGAADRLAAYVAAVVPPLFACDAKLAAAALQRQDARTALAQFAEDAGARSGEAAPRLPAAS